MPTSPSPVPDAPPNRYQALIAEMQAEFPRFRVIHKRDSPLHKAIHYALIAITLGGMREYIDGYQTTMGYRVYVTSNWDRKDPDLRYITMRHERIHMQQFRRYTFLGMSFLYLLVPLPMGLAYFRARFEKEAYEESMRAASEVFGIEHIKEPAYRQRIIDQFTGASYGWMWPFRRKLEHWYDSVVDKLVSENDQATIHDIR